MKKKAIVLYSSLAILLTSCLNQENLKYKEVVVYRGSHRAIKQTLNSDNRLVSEQEFEVRDGKLIPNGYIKEYYGNGILKYLSFFDNGKRSDNLYEFYSSASLKSMALPSGDSIRFGPYGSQLNHRPLFSLDGVADTVVIGSIIPVSHKLIVLSKIETAVKSQLFDSSESLVWENEKSRRTDGYSVSYFFAMEKLDSPGRYKYVATATYKDSATNTPLFSKTLDFDFVVVKEPRKTRAQKR